MVGAVDLNEFSRGSVADKLEVYVWDEEASFIRIMYIMLNQKDGDFFYLVFFKSPTLIHLWLFSTARRMYGWLSKYFSSN